MLLDVYAQKHYLLLDGAQNVNFSRLAYELELKESCKLLYHGTQLDFVSDVSPCLIEIDINSLLYKRFIQETQISEKGIYISSNADFKDTFQHLQSLLFATLEDKSEILFRFYDPHVLCCCEHALSFADIERLLGMSRLWKWTDIDNAGEWRTLQRATSITAPEYGMVTNKLKNKFMITSELYEEYCKNKDRFFIEKMKETFFEKEISFDHQVFPELARKSIARARKYGFTYESTLTLFTLLFIIKGEMFYEKKDIRNILENMHMHQLEKMELILDHVVN